MENIHAKISEYLQKNKKNSKLTKTEVDDVTSLLKVGLSEGSVTLEYLVETLIDLHYAVTSEFMQSVFPDLSSEVRSQFIKIFLRSGKIVKNANNFGINRSLMIVNKLLKIQGIDELIHAILKSNVKKAYGKDGGKKAGELLSKLCFEKSHGRLLSLDYSSWEPTELRNLSLWLDNAIAYSIDPDIFVSYQAFLTRYGLPMTKRQLGMSSSPSGEVKMLDNSTRSIKDVSVSSSPREEHKGKIGQLIFDLKTEIDQIVSQKYALSRELEVTKGRLEQVVKEKNELLAQLTVAAKEFNRLEAEVKRREMIIKDADQKIDEMNQRLEYAYKADKRAGNLELSSFRNDLIKTLRLDYENYKKLEHKEPGQYHLYYEGLLDVVENIFLSLRRKGIDITNVNEG